MADDVLVALEHVSKKYCRSLKHSMVYGVMDIGRNMLGLSSHSERLRSTEFWAVNDVSFELTRGESLGLIGPNGSGKTTLLKMINGIFWPDKGKILARGQVGALIAVGAGFHPLLTGRENIYLNGAILGMSKGEIKRKFDSIVAFAGVEDFLDSPVKHYSSGMFVRLGFAVAIHCEPQILLIDEILAVGDIEFQAKCMGRMRELEREGIAKIFVSHNLNSVYHVCPKSIYLFGGKVRDYGRTLDIIAHYRKDILMSPESESLAANGLRTGTREMTIEKVQFLNKDGQARGAFKRGEPLVLRIAFSSPKVIHDPFFSLEFENEAGVLVSKPITKDHGFRIKSVQGSNAIYYCIDALPFNVGRYIVTVAVFDSNGFIDYDTHRRMYDFVVEDGLIDNRIRERFGLVYIPAKWRLETSGSI